MVVVAWRCIRMYVIVEPLHFWSGALCFLEHKITTTKAYSSFPYVSDVVQCTQYNGVHQNPVRSLIQIINEWQLRFS